MELALLIFQPGKLVSCFVNSAFSFTVRAKHLRKPVFILKCGEKDEGGITYPNTT